MRFDKQEKEALRYALQDFEGEVFLFGSRVDDSQKGGDIDIMVIPEKRANNLKLSLEIQKRFFSRCEQKLDVVVFDKKNPFCREVLKNGKRINRKAI